MAWPTAGFDCRSVIFLGKTMKVQKWKCCVKPDSNPHPMDLCCAFWITTTPHSWLHEVRYICSKCVLVKCLYQSLYPWAKYLTQPWSVTRWMKDNIGMKGIIVMKIKFHSVLDYHVNERILLTIPAFVLGKYSQCLITHTGKCWDMVGILHNIPSIYTGKAWEIFLVSDQTFCTRTSHLHNSSNFPVNSQQFLTIPSVWSDRHLENLVGILHNIPSIHTGKYSQCLIRHFVPVNLICIFRQNSRQIPSKFWPFPLFLTIAWDKQRSDSQVEIPLFPNGTSRNIPRIFWW